MDGAWVSLTDIRAAEQTGIGDIAFVEGIVTPSAGTHVFKATGARLAGATAVTPIVGVGYANYIIVEDITGGTPAVPATSVPVGILGQSQITANSAAATALNNVISVNATVAAGRTIRVRFETYVQNSAPGASAGARIGLYMDGSSTGIGAAGQIQQSDQRLTAAAVPEKFVAEAIVSPAAGAHTFFVNIDNGGSGNITLVAGALYPTVLSVEDVTPTPAASTALPSSTIGFLDNQSPASTTSVVASTLAATVTVAGGRQLRITGKMHMISSVVGDRVILQIREGATVLNAAYLHVAAAASGDDVFVSHILSPSAGMHTYTLWYGRDAGTGTVSIYNNFGVDTVYILVEDITGVSFYSPSVPGFTLAQSAVRPPTPQPGTAIYEQDSGVVMFFNGTEWRRVAPPGVAVARGQGVGNTVSATYVDYPGPLDIIFTKRSAGTYVDVQITGSTYATTATGPITIGIRINGVDYDVALFFHNNTGVHASYAGSMAALAGLAAGTYTCRVRWHTNGTAVANTDANDLCSVRIQEITPS